MGKIMLNDMEFIAKHGACPHEYEFDQKFTVNVNLKTEAVKDAGATDELEKTINYADVFQLIENVMYGEHVNLIETLAYQIGHIIIDKYSNVSEVKVTVRKMQPPITNFNGTAAVELKINRNEAKQ